MTEQSPRLDWNSIVIAVVGGDEREQEIARLAAETGAVVRAYGFPWPTRGIDGVTLAADAADAVKGARYVLFPIPGMAADGSLYAPDAAAPIEPNDALLKKLAQGAHIITGTASEGLRSAATRVGAEVHEYESDQELMLLRAPAIAEGAVGIAIANTDVTIHRAEIAVVGYGKIGSVLARTLIALGAHVHVAARNPIQRAAALTAGADPIPLDELQNVVPKLQMLFSTVPAPVVNKEILGRLPRGSLVIDLAAPPGSVDLTAADGLGHRAVWARGLGRRAPVTVGQSQWMGIKRRIEAIEESEGNSKR
jgi:dipicolinate synthase subunit A